MRDDDLDRILSQQNEILPSSGFAASVMDAVQREAAVPPAIPFPWKRAIPGVAIAGLALMGVFVGFVELARRAADIQVRSAPLPVLVPILQAMINGRSGWIALVLLVTVASVVLPLRPPYGRS